MTTASARQGALTYQVHIGGRGLSAMTHNALAELVLRRLDGVPPPEGIDVRIQVWREGRELDWEDQNSRAEVLRATLRGLLQSGRLALSVRSR